MKKLSTSNVILSFSIFPMIVNIVVSLTLLLLLAILIFINSLNSEFNVNGMLLFLWTALAYVIAGGYYIKLMSIIFAIITFINFIFSIYLAKTECSIFYKLNYLYLTVVIFIIFTIFLYAFIFLYSLFFSNYSNLYADYHLWILLYSFINSISIILIARLVLPKDRG